VVDYDKSVQFIGIPSPATPEEIWELITRALRGHSDLKPFRKLKVNLSGNLLFHKFYFGVGCSCSTVGMISVEVAQSKTLKEVEAVIPQMVSSLNDQAWAFRNMSCEIHTRIRMGGAMA
jgi:hypothetical protein